VTWLDVLLLALLALSAIGGYRRGALLQITGLLGLAAGVILAAVFAPSIARLSHDRGARSLIALGFIGVAFAAGILAGAIVGNRLKRRARAGRFQRVDAIAGAAISVLSLFLTIWFLALNLASGPFPQISRGIRESTVVQEIARVMPEPPSLIGELRSVLNSFGLPDVFIGLPPDPAAAVSPPTDAQVLRAQEAAAGSTVEVLGDGCYTGFYDQGSGFVVARDYVITNAHVVGGTTRQWVHQGSRDFSASVVGFDPGLDVAILHVPGLPALPLGLESREETRGAVGAVLGYPAGGPLTTVKAAVRATIDAVGRDIYGGGVITRRMYEIQAEVRHGNSGGPFVLDDGKVAGLVFASSVEDDQVGYAMVIDQLEPLIDRSVGSRTVVGTESCTG
jgi:S1-C subfamily serine protease